VTPFCEIREPYDARLPLRFIWSAAFSGDGAKLAVGCWNAKAHVFLMDDVLLHAGQVALGGAGAREDLVPVPEPSPQREYVRLDRVYSVAISHSGRLLAVGGRDKQVAVYNTESEREEVVFASTFEDFVYCVSLTETMVAFGGVAKGATVFDIVNHRKVFSCEAGDAVWSVALCAESRYLAVAGADRRAVLYDLQARPAVQVMHFPQPSVVDAVCFSAAGTLAWGSGKFAAVYGRGTSWSKRPGINFVSSLLDDSEVATEALKQALLRDMSMVNYYDPITKQSFLASLCANGSRSAVHMVLNLTIDHGCRLRLVPESQILSLLGLAGRTRDCELIKLILQVRVRVRGVCVCLRLCVRLCALGWA
jgi:hypothetical protein